MFKRSSLRHIRIDVLSRPDCSLCHKAEFAIRRLITNMKLSPTRFQINNVNIEQDQELMDEFQLSIPVVQIDGKTVSEGRIDIPLIRACLEEKLQP